jgi:hypothetical protein
MSTFTKKAAVSAADMRTAAKKIAARVALLKHPAVKAAFESFPRSQRKDVNMALTTYGDSVYMNLSLRELDSFKDKQLTRILEQFMGSEWTARVNEYTDGTPNKDFHFERRVALTSPAYSAADPHMVGDRFAIHVSIYAYVKSDSPLCRIVVTGVTERVVREEVKQIVCA